MSNDLRRLGLPGPQGVRLIPRPERAASSGRKAFVSLVRLGGRVNPVRNLCMEFKPLEAALLLFATIGPLKVTIVCASLTAEASPEFLRRVAFRSVLIASIICLVFAVLGETILRLFHVSVPAFQIAGGIIVLLFSLEMVMGKSGSDNGGDGSEEKRGEPSLDIATYPLAIPLMASVSGLVAIVSLLAQHDDLAALLFLTVMIAAHHDDRLLLPSSLPDHCEGGGPGCSPGRRQADGGDLDRVAVELILMGLIGLGIVAKPAARSAGESPSLRLETPYIRSTPSDRT